MGRSIGSGPATYLAANYEVGALVLISPFTSIRAVVKHFVGNLFSYIVKERFENILNMNKIKCPIHIIHGKADTFIPY